MLESPVDHARRINRTWIVHGHLAQDTERYLAALEERQPELLQEVCARAVAATQKASKEQRDPKPDFYVELFRHATVEEQNIYLQDHPWTRHLLMRFPTADGAESADRVKSRHSETVGSSEDASTE